LAILNTRDLTRACCGGGWVALKKEGLLRLPGNMDKTNRLIKLFDNGMSTWHELYDESNAIQATDLTRTIASLKSYSSIDLHDADPHDIARILRIFLRDLPEPVIPFDLYEPLVSIQRMWRLAGSTHVRERLRM
jgi:hypothetical protein